MKFEAKRVGNEVTVIISDGSFMAAYNGISRAYFDMDNPFEAIRIAIYGCESYLGMFTVSDSVAGQLIAEFKKLGVYQESKPVMQSVAC